ncbi:MAG TPA: aminopeptidase P family protein [Thermoleophilia bacterium]|nr:aminopeptidase P family protein [Thermoleophilia bacterium]
MSRKARGVVEVVDDAGDRPYDDRLETLRSSLGLDGLSGLLVFDPVNIRYLTGFTGSAGVVLVRPDECLLVSDFRYRVQAREQAPVARFVELEGAFSPLAPELVEGFEGCLGVEKDHLKVEEWEALAPALEGLDVSLVRGHVRKMRRVKSAGELRAVREASLLAVQVMERLSLMQVVGRTERDVALELEVWARKHGSEGIPFPYILAWGPNSAKPHAEPGDTVIGQGGLLVVDLGAVVDGYASDITRTFSTGKVGPEEARAHRVTLEAQEAARREAGPGIACRHVDKVARDVIEGEGLGDFFKHGLGHGVGLEVHEEPGLSSRSEDVLEPGMVVTIEPGIYLEGVGGVRIEDSVAVTETGVEVLTEMDRGLLTLS